MSLDKMKLSDEIAQSTTFVHEKPNSDGSRSSRAALLFTLEQYKSIVADAEGSPFLAVLFCIPCWTTVADVGYCDGQEAEDMMASLRRRLEQGLPPDTDEEQMEKQRQVMQQKRREQQQQQQRRQQSSRPARSV